MFIPVKFEHRQKADWPHLTHIRIIQEKADTNSGQRSLDYIRQLLDRHGYVEIARLDRNIFPTARRAHDMYATLRHMANDRTSGAKPENKGLIELGYIVENNS